MKSMFSRNVNVPYIRTDSFYGFLRIETNSKTFFEEHRTGKRSLCTRIIHESFTHVQNFNSRLFCFALNWKCKFKKIRSDT